MQKLYKLMWCQDEHIPQLKALFAICFPEEKWTSASFRKFTAHNHSDNTIKVLLDRNNVVLGALLYTLRANECRVRRIAVVPDHRRQGLASFMLDSLVGPKSSTRRDNFVVRVREDYLLGQLFFRDCKFGFKFDPKSKHVYEDRMAGYTFRLKKPVLMSVPSS